MRFVSNALALARVERTAAINKIIVGAVEAAVLDLRHAEDAPNQLEGYGITPAQWSPPRACRAALLGVGGHLQDPGDNPRAE